MENDKIIMEQVTISDYLESRGYNKKLYGKLVEAIKANCFKLLRDYPEVEICISISAKYQTPIILISENDTIPERIGSFDRAIQEALDEVGFTYIYAEDRSDYYRIEFED